MMEEAKLRRARGALEAGRANAALHPLVEAWRATRAPALAPIIERLTVRLAPPPERLTAAQRRARHAISAAKWRVLVQGGAATDLQEALATLPTRRVPVLRERLHLLAEVGVDPRISAVVLPLIEEPGHGGADAQSIRLAALTVFLRQRDVRFIDAFRQLRGRLASRDLGSALDDALKEVDTWSAQQLSAGALLELERIEALLDDRAVPHDTSALPVTTLFAAVYRDPDALDARLVLADRLQEAGNPRGELIALQCGRSRDERPSVREQELLKRYGRKWLGPIAPALSDGFEYERGFVARAALEDLELETGIGTQPEWATLTHLNLWRYESIGTEGFLFSDHLRSLVAVRDVGQTDLALLSSGAPRRWTELGLCGARVSTLWDHATSREQLAALPHVAPALVRLRCPGLGADLGELRRLCARLSALQELALGFEPERVGELWRMAEASRLRSVTLLASVDLTFDLASYALTISCDEDARDFYALRSQHPARRRFTPASLDPVLSASGALAALRLRSFTLRLPLRATLREDAVARGNERMPIGALRELARGLGVELRIEPASAARVSVARGL